VKVHRTLILSFKLPKERLERLVKIDARLRALVNLAVRGYKVDPLDLSQTALTLLYKRRFLESFQFGKSPKRWFCRIPLPCTVLRVANGSKRGDTAAPILLDMDRGVVKVRYIYGETLEFKLEKSHIKWIKERIAEGGDVKFGLVYVKRGKLNVALVFERRVKPEKSPSTILVVDVNSWKYGVTYAVITSRTKTVKPVRRRPDVGYIERLYGEIVELSRRYGVLRRLGLSKSPEGRVVWRELKLKRCKLHRYLKDFSNKLANELVGAARLANARIVIDYFPDSIRRELLEERLPRGLAKIYMLYIPRLVKLIENQAKWYGIPIEFKHIPSTICPVCGSKLKQGGDRVMKCSNCEFEADRDTVPLYWALKQTSTPKLVPNEGS